MSLLPIGSPSPSAGSDFLQLDIGAAPVGGKADRLTARLREALADGRLSVGAVLPPTRVPAAELRVSRGVVTEAYRRPAEDGRVEGGRRRGTTVVAPPLPEPPTAGSRGVDAGRARDGGRAERTASGYADGVVGRLRGRDPGSGGAGEGAGLDPFVSSPGPEVFDRLRLRTARSSHHDHVDLTRGVPDLGAFPRAAWLRREREVLAELPAIALAYGDQRGVPGLRRVIAARLARTRGVHADPEAVVIVSGVAQALGLLAPVLRVDGVDAVAVEYPGSLSLRQHLRHAGLATPPAPIRADGPDVSALRASGAGAVSVTPAHHFPTGAVMAGERRRALPAWAREGGLVLEDDHDAEHRYDRPPVPALRGQDPERVCHLGGVSKVLAPALRIGWVLPTPRHHEAVIEGKRFADLGNATLPQLVLARLIESGNLERHQRSTGRRHRSRRDATVAALAAHLPKAVVHGAAAGLHLTITLPASEVREIDLAAAAMGRGVPPGAWSSATGP
ncbi:PLP-dependent aminotransferase family protein (plasmid) [Streptomyces sp. BI20]|uniref:aminotransferase-like domain-containing protein n=1 Tax=Streptomyces sp. BI20 TaxID=3403460 RepID=UPI003C71DE3D